MTPDKYEIVEKVHAIFTQSGYTLAAAESCTGGLISHYVTSLPGASSFFKAGVVSYSVSSKIDILDLSPDTISLYGSVSEETAREMAEKIRIRAGTDYAVATTGNLGPDVLEGKERGLVYISACRAGCTVAKEIRMDGARSENKEEAALSALELLIELAEDRSG